MAAIRIISSGLGLLLGSALPLCAAPLRVCADPNNLPYSKSDGEGFELRIAQLIGAHLNREVQFVWRAQRRGFLREGLNAGLCDLVTAIPPATFSIRTTRAYYRSTYAFVTRPGEPPVESLDDPSLRSRRVGVQLIGEDGMNTPPAHALAARGIVENVRGFSVFGDYSSASPAAAIVEAVARGDVDVAAVWGPVAGFFAARQQPPLTVTPIRPKPGERFAMAFDIAMGVRLQDGALADAVQDALDAHRDEIRDILYAAHVPLVERRLEPHSSEIGNARR